MYCPKETDVALSDRTLPLGVPVQGCPQCQGAWIGGEAYRQWQIDQGIDPDMPAAERPLQAPPSAYALNGPFPPLDNRAALCPECRHYLVRGRVRLDDGAFFVERCPNCKGYWCDGGEWDILQQLSLHTHLEAIFQEAWQAKVKALEDFQREQTATLEKLGPDIAQRVFELGDLLASHPHGDFGVAYLMRRVSQ